MRIAILGLGCVGATTAACLAKTGHHVLGIDLDPSRVAAVAAGRSPVVEPMVDALLAEGVADGRVRGGLAIDSEIDRLDLVLVCVGTPSRADGQLDLSQLLASAGQLGRALRRRRAEAPLLLAFRSTMPPGTMDRLVLPALLQAAGEPPGPALRGGLQPAIPARGHRGQGLPGTAQDRGRRARARHRQTAARHL